MRLCPNPPQPPCLDTRRPAALHPCNAKAIRPHLNHLQRQGLTLYFLPAYSPELNRIEKLWWQIKHRWMGVCWRDKDTLEQQVTAILGKVGSELEFKF
jgi:transposase